MNGDSSAASHAHIGEPSIETIAVMSDVANVLPAQPGHDPAGDASPVAVAIRPQASSEGDALDAALRDMSRAFIEDFVDARMGTQHNNFEHRSRVLRQLTATLATMREQEAATAI